MILAQLPDPQLQPLLFAKVTKYMLHGPCGADNPQAKCMVNGKCSKCFPKEYRERTDWAEDSYPLYARPDNGLVFDVKHKLHHMNHYQADQEIPENDVYDYGLWDLNRILVGMGRSLADFPLMPPPQQQWAHRIPNPLLQAEQYDVDKMATLVDKQRTIFNLDQAAAFDTVLESVTVRR